MFDNNQKEKGEIENQGGISNYSQTENSGEIKGEGDKNKRDLKNISEISDSVPASNPKVPQSQAEDIFAGSETTKDVNSSDIPKPDIFRPINQELKRSEDERIDEHEKQASKNKKLFFLLFIIIVFLFLVLAGVWIFRYLTLKPKNLEQKEFIETDLSQEDNIIEENILEEPVQEPHLQNDQNEETAREDNNVENNIIIEDSDNDGLSDEEERELGTNLNKTDTDMDKLFDYEEVKVYKTDPLDPDSDKDGFLDGEEVLSGYNPLGAGKLYDIK